MADLLGIEKVLSGMGARRICILAPFVDLGGGNVII